MKLFLLSLLGKPLSNWLQNYANEHNCYVCMDEPMYSPLRFNSFIQVPHIVFDEEDGDHYWVCPHPKPCRYCKNNKKCKQLGDKIPRRLKKLYKFIDYKKLYMPQK